MARLTAGTAAVSTLAADFEMALPSFLQHLKVLEGSGLIETRKEGRVRHCTLSPTALGAAEDWLGSQRRLWEGRLDRMEALVSRLEAERTEDD